MPGSNGAQFGEGDNATSIEEMRHFDTLPPELRELLNYSVLDWSAAQLGRASPGGRDAHRIDRHHQARSAHAAS
jgi:hypothetical protein